MFCRQISRDDVWLELYDRPDIFNILTNKSRLTTGIIMSDINVACIHV